MFNISNFLENIQKITYGINIAILEDEDTKDMLMKYVDTVNLIFKMEIMSASPSENNEEELSFDVVWKSRTEFPPALTVDDLSIESNAKMAAEFQTETIFSIHEGLWKFARRMASKYNVKFKGGHTQKFEGSKKKSVAARIEEAMNAGQADVTFTKDEIATQTARVYASNLANLTGRKIRVTIEQDAIKIIFKESTKQEILKGELMKLWHRAVHEIGLNDTEDIFRDVVATNSLEDVITGGPSSEVVDSYLKLHANSVQDLQRNDLSPVEDLLEKAPEEVIPLELDPESNQFKIPVEEKKSDQKNDSEEDTDF